MESFRLKNFRFLIWISILIVIMYLINCNVSKHKLIIQDKNYLDKKHILNPELNSFLKFNINPANLCESDDNEFMFIYSFTRLDDFALRQAIRETWGNSTLFPNIKLAFVLGYSTDSEKNLLINNESKLNHDIIQGNFIDTYRNLPYKLLTAFKWITRYCSNAKFIIRIHGDIFLNTFKLIKFFQNPSDFFIDFKYNSNTLICEINKNIRPADLGGKHLVTREEHMNILNGIDAFPDYCNGPFEITTTNMIEKLYLKSYYTKVFFIDDAYEGLLVDKIKNVTYLEAKHYAVNTNDMILIKHFLFIKIADSEDYYSIWYRLLKRYKLFTYVINYDPKNFDK